VSPARRVDEEINFDRIATAHLPERAGILSAEQLTISAVPLADSTSDSFAIVARENARLESQTISGTADIITYDHSKEQFILRAEGQGSVAVNHRAGLESKFNKLVGKRFEYYRRTNQLNAEEIRSLDVGE
jgi:lipopolysaccharide export system protein LptA